VMSLASVLRATCQEIQGLSLARNRTLACDSSSRDAVIRCDHAILKRVIWNLFQNALEASPCGSTVTWSCSPGENKTARFSIHNATFIEPEDQMRVFSRSFTTKGHGRGLGTYSVKLLTERYLGGSVSFSSDCGSGTTFTVCLPLQ
jgi:signal transduction histidine kinase